VLEISEAFVVTLERFWVGLGCECSAFRPMKEELALKSWNMGASGASAGILEHEISRRSSEIPTIAAGWSGKCESAFSYEVMAS